MSNGLLLPRFYRFRDLHGINRPFVLKDSQITWGNFFYSEIDSYMIFIEMIIPGPFYNPGIRD